MLGRKEPYTEIGISRVPCVRCGKSSSQQWQVCALDNRYFGVCTTCDVDLNDLVLSFFRIPELHKFMKRYREKLGVR